MTKRQGIRIIAFLLLVFFLVSFLSQLFKTDDIETMPMFSGFRRLKKDTVDAVYIGTSGAYDYWIAAQAFDDYGMTVYPLCANSFPAWLCLTVLKDAVQRQHPKLALIDMRMFVAQPYDRPKKLISASRRVIDALPLFSAARREAIRRSLPLINAASSDKQNALTLMFPVFSDHERWKLNYYSFRDSLCMTPTEYLGYYMKKVNTIRITPQEWVRITGEQPIDETSEGYLTELIDYAASAGIELLFIDSPVVVERDGIRQRLNSLYRKLTGLGAAALSFNTEENRKLYPFDNTNDFFNKNHVNYYGAAKYTFYLSAWLKEHYDLPDHRNDPLCTPDWQGVNERIRDQIRIWEQEGIRKTELEEEEKEEEPD